jgi:hypothetical protein
MTRSDLQLGRDVELGAIAVSSVRCGDWPLQM